MNSNPSFYPKHLAKQYVGLWSLDQARGHGGPLGQPVVVSPALGEPASNVSSNGKRSVTPVGGNQHLNQSTGGGSTESSPSFSTIMDTSVSSRQNQEPSKKILQGLPDSFITAMRRLFDLLDIEQAGRVHIHGMLFLYHYIKISVFRQHFDSTYYIRILERYFILKLSFFP